MSDGQGHQAPRPKRMCCAHPPSQIVAGIIIRPDLIDAVTRAGEVCVTMLVARERGGARPGVAPPGIPAAAGPASLPTSGGTHG